MSGGCSAASPWTKCSRSSSSMIFLVSAKACSGHRDTNNCYLYTPAAFWQLEMIRHCGIWQSTRTGNLRISTRAIFCRPRGFLHGSAWSSCAGTVQMLQRWYMSAPLRARAICVCLYVSRSPAGHHTASHLEAYKHLIELRLTKAEAQLLQSSGQSTATTQLPEHDASCMT